jgi:hypothetical protein
MGKIGIFAKIGKALGIGAKGAGVATKGSGAIKLGALGGISSFFGLEWLTNGGLFRAVGGTLGITEAAASILVVAVVMVGVSIVFYALYKKLSRRK